VRLGQRHLGDSIFVDLDQVASGVCGACAIAVTASSPSPKAPRSTLRPPPTRMTDRGARLAYQLWRFLLVRGLPPSRAHSRPAAAGFAAPAPAESNRQRGSPRRVCDEQPSPTTTRTRTSHDADALDAVTTLVRLRRARPLPRSHLESHRRRAPRELQARKRSPRR
jgi:hypothetical protein